MTHTFTDEELAAHDRAVEQRALRDAADELTNMPRLPFRGYDASWLHARADALGEQP